MLLKITEKCSMGCTHCMNSATPEGRHMSEKVLDDALEFIMKNHIGLHVVVSGGEPTEHPNFMEFMDKILNKLTWCSYPVSIVITTNGLWCLEHPEESKSLVRKTEYLQVFWQVSTDKRYYPKELPIHKKLWREPGFLLCTDCVEAVYPQGRALENDIPWSAKASRCFNVRAMSKQIPDASVFTLFNGMAIRGYSCTPSIRVDGSISVGESDLCPSVTSIYDKPEDIIKKIQEFKCHKCDFINNKLPEMYRRFL